MLALQPDAVVRRKPLRISALPKQAVAVLDSISDLQIRVWEPQMGWRQLSGNRKENPQGLEIRLTRQTPQGEEHYRQVLGPLD